MERTKLVCTQHDLIKLKEKLQKMDNVDQCTRERERERERERKTERELTLNGDFLNSQRLVLASLHKDIPMGCKDFVLPEPF